MPSIILFLGYLPFTLDKTTLSGIPRAYRHLKGSARKKLGTMLGADGATTSWEQGENKPYKRTLQQINKLSNEHLRSI